MDGNGCGGCLSRRTVVVGAVALAGAAAGCARYGGESAPPPAAAPAEGEVLGKAADVPVGGGTVFRDQKIVVTQPTAGEFKGFSAVCTHQGCIVADVTDGTINCTCHGSSFEIADGAVAGGPAGSPLPAEQVSVNSAGDLVRGGSAPATTTSDEPTSEPTSEPAPPAGLASTADIPVGGGKVFGDEQVVITQPEPGEFVGFSAVCTHQGCVVADVSNGTINCTCHGSKFRVADGGVANGPAREPLPTRALTVDGDQISLA
jgi:Rieske Fe-S protein